MSKSNNAIRKTLFTICNHFNRKNSSDCLEKMSKRDPFVAGGIANQIASKCYNYLGQSDLHGTNSLKSTPTYVIKGDSTIILTSWDYNSLKTLARFNLLASNLVWQWLEFIGRVYELYRLNSNISRTLVGNKTVDHFDVVGASPTGADPTTS